MNFRFAICDLRLNAAPRVRPHALCISNRKSKIENRKFRPGYSFTEVMFAVVILGIGFIMIAAIFPAAIHQSMTTAQETNGAAIARSAVEHLKQAAQFVGDPANPVAPMMPALQAVGERGKVYSLRDAQPATDTTYIWLNNQPAPPPQIPPVQPWFADQLWDVCKGDVISRNDPRLAWVAFYKREPAAVAGGKPSSAAQVIIITCEVRNRSSYDQTDIGIPAPPSIVNLQGRPVRITIDLTTIPVSATLADDSLIGAKDAAAEGAYLIIANDRLAAPNTGIFNGRILRLGASLGNDRWEFAAGGDYVPDSGGNGKLETPPGTGDDINLPIAPNYAEAFIVGRNFIGGDGTPGTPLLFEGLAQDVSVYTTFVSGIR